jgi:hypothetical protein
MPDSPAEVDDHALDPPVHCPDGSLLADQPADSDLLFVLAALCNYVTIVEVAILAATLPRP